MDPNCIDPINTLIKLTLDRPADEIQPIRTISDPLSIGASATASSEHSPDKGAANVVAGNAKEFSEGIFVKSSWRPASSDKQPWLVLTLNTPKEVSQIKLMEGKFGNSSSVQQYVVEAKVSNKWKTIHSGTSVGGDCNILLKNSVTSDSFRLSIVEKKGNVDINSFELYK